MFDLQIRTGQWLDARVTCDELVRASLIDKDDAKRRKAVLSYQLSQLARDGGDAAGALSHLRDANTLAPGLISAVADLAGRWADAGKARKAVKLIEEAWSAVPHPALLQPYWRARNASDALERVRATEKLVQSQPLHLESLIALARASLDARLWGEARQDLEKALAATPAPQARIFRMMAELEETENAASDLAREWLMRASQATADPAWVCHHCGNTVADWSAICGKCEEFDSFDWRTPQSVLALAEPPRLETDVGDMVSLPPRGAEAG